MPMETRAVRHVLFPPPRYVHDHPNLPTQRFCSPYRKSNHCFIFCFVQLFIRKFFCFLFLRLLLTMFYCTLSRYTARFRLIRQLRSRHSQNGTLMVALRGRLRGTTLKSYFVLAASLTIPSAPVPAIFLSCVTATPPRANRLRPTLVPLP